MDVYGWFTEGFETADLCEARTLLLESTAAIDVSGSRLLRCTTLDETSLCFCPTRLQDAS